MQNNRVGRWCAGNGENLKENGYERVRSEGHPGRNRGEPAGFQPIRPKKGRMKRGECSGKNQSRGSCCNF